MHDTSSKEREIVQLICTVYPLRYPASVLESFITLFATALMIIVVVRSFGKENIDHKLQRQIEQQNNTEGGRSGSTSVYLPTYLENV